MCFLKLYVTPRYSDRYPCHQNLLEDSLLSFGTIAIWMDNSVTGDCPCSIPLGASNTSPVCQPRISPDIAKYLLEGKIVSG